MAGGEPDADACTARRASLRRTDSARTAGGEEDNWAYVLPSGQRVLIVLGVPYGHVRLISDPPELGPVLTALGITSDDPRLHRYPEPYPTE